MSISHLFTKFADGTKPAMMEEGGERLDQPCLFDLELELLRSVFP
jgi:hypothetical protein